MPSDSSSPPTPPPPTDSPPTTKPPNLGRASPSSPPTSPEQSRLSSESDLFADAPVYRSMAVAPPAIGHVDGPKLFDKDSYVTTKPAPVSKEAPQQKIPTVRAAPPTTPGKVPEMIDLEFDFLTPFSFITVAEAPPTVRAGVEKSLFTQSISFSGKKNELKCTYDGTKGEAVVFYVLFFTRENKCLVECRRWSGDCVVFQRIKKCLWEAANGAVAGEMGQGVVDLEGEEVRKVTPLHEGEMHKSMARASFEGIVATLLKESAKQESKEYAMKCLTMFGGEWGQHVLLRADLVQMLASMADGLGALWGIVKGSKAVGLSGGAVDSLSACVPELVSAVRRCDKDCGSAYFAVCILNEVVKRKGEIGAKIDSAIFEYARDIGAMKLGKLAEACIEILVEIQCSA